MAPQALTNKSLILRRYLSIFILIFNWLDSRVDIQTWSSLCSPRSQLHCPCPLLLQTLYNCTLWAPPPPPSACCLLNIPENIVNEDRIGRENVKMKNLNNYKWCFVVESCKCHNFIVIQNGALFRYHVSRWHSVVRVAGFKPVGAEKRSGSIPPSGRTFWSESGLRNSLSRLLMQKLF